MASTAANRWPFAENQASKTDLQVESVNAGHACARNTASGDESKSGRNRRCAVAEAPLASARYRPRLGKRALSQAAGNGVHRVFHLNRVRKGAARRRRSLQGQSGMVFSNRRFESETICRNAFYADHPPTQATQSSRAGYDVMRRTARIARPTRSRPHCLRSSPATRTGLIFGLTFRDLHYGSSTKIILSLS